MNADDFEQQLERQPLRALPPEWREQILGKARVESPSELSSLGSPAAQWWRELLWPCPQAWAGVVTVWLVIFGLRFVANSESGANPPLTVGPPPPEWRALLAEQRSLLAELNPAPPAPPDPKHIEPADRPRTQLTWPLKQAVI